VTFDPHCPACLAGAHAAGHPPPEEPEPEPPIPGMAFLMLIVVGLLFIAAWGGFMWLLVKALG
jgi:hypothetical protein